MPPSNRPQALLKLSSTLRERIKRMRTDAMSSLFAIPSVAMPYACNDYPMPFPYTDGPAARELATRQFARSALSANVAPFTWDEINAALHETNGLQVDSFRYEACLYWPYEEVTANVYPAAPRTDILVISGSLDTTTSPAMALQIAQRWPAARILTVDGGDHFVLNGPRSACARSAAVRFLRDPGTYSQSRCAPDPIEQL
jgi:pimeloyl-ACP methyl ester carboxylesterase